MAIEFKSKATQSILRDMVLDEWRTMTDERSELVERWKRCLMAYLREHDRAWVEQAKKAGRSRRYVPLSYDAVETLCPQIMDPIFGFETAQRVRPIREGGSTEEDDEAASQMRFLLRYQMRYGKYQRTAEMAVKQMLILGNCPWTMVWQTVKAPDYGHFADAMRKWMEQAAEHERLKGELLDEYEKIAMRAVMLGGDAPPPPDIAPPPPMPRDLETVFAGPVLKIASIFNYVQEQHPNDDFAAARILRSWRTKQYLKGLTHPGPDGYRIYENLDEVQDITSEERTGDNSAEILFKRAIGMGMPKGRDKVEVKERHGAFEIPSGPDAGRYENYILTVFNNTLVRAEPSPLYTGRPLWNNARLIMFEGAVYGQGVVEAGLSEQDSANAIHNQNIDAVASVIQPEYEVVQDQLAEPMKPSGPGARHNVMVQGTITPIAKNYSGIPMGAQQLAEVIARHERITGAVNTGIAPSETATRTARNQGVISAKLRKHVEAVEQELIDESLNMAMEMNAQYIDDETVIAVTQDSDNKIARISPQTIRRGWIVYSSGSKHMADKDARIQNLLMAKQMAGQDVAAGMPSTVDMVALDRRLYQEILGEAEDIVKSREQYEAEVQQYQANLMAQQAMQAVAKGAGGGGAGQAEGVGANPQGQGSVQ